MRRKAAADKEKRLSAATYNALDWSRFPSEHVADVDELPPC